MLVGWVDVRMIVSRVLLNLFYCLIFYSAMSSNMLNLHTSLLLFHLAVGRLTLLSPVPDGQQACRRSTSNLIEPLLNCPKHSEGLMQEASSLWTLSFCQASTIIPSSQTNGHSGTPCKEDTFWNNTMLGFSLIHICDWMQMRTRHSNRVGNNVFFLSQRLQRAPNPACKPEIPRFCPKSGMV